MAKFQSRVGKRKEWVDALRGIAMILVVLVHALSKDVAGWEIYNVFTGPVLITMFFAVSGYVFNDRDGNQKLFYENLFVRAAFPWLFLSLILFRILLIPVQGIQWFLDFVLKLFSGDVFWYMPCYIVASIIWFYILKYCTSDLFVCVAAGLCFSAGLIMDHFGICDFAMINRAFCVQVFILIGYLFKKFEQKLLNSYWILAVGGVMLYLLLAAVTIMLFPGQYLDVHLNMYYNVPLCLSMIFVGCVTLMLVGAKLDFAPRVLVFIGQNTLVYYMTHSLVLSLVNRVFVIIGIRWASDWPMAMMKTGCTLVGCGIISVLLNRYAPALVGKQKRNRA